jgi:hypothetical protein
MSAGIISLLVITQYLSASEQGFYYTFFSIIALQIFFELGVGTIVVQFQSHEMAHLSWGSKGTLEGNKIALSRFRSLFLFHAKWYAAIALLLVIIVLPIGMVFFVQDIKNSVEVSWQAPWVCLILATALNMLISPAFSIFESGGRVEEVARVRMFSAVVASLVGWLMLVSGFGLFSLAGSTLASIVCSLIWLHSGKLIVLRKLLTEDLTSARVSWVNEIWPFQWKISISWMSGYLIFQLFVPVIFALQGAVEAGKMGMILSIATAITAIPMAWINTKIPTFGYLIAKHRFSELDSLFFIALRQSLGLMAFLAISFLVADYVANSFELKIAHRLPGPLAVAFLMLASTINYFVYAQSVYLRAHKEEPFLYPSLVLGVVVGISTWLVAEKYGVTGVSFSYCLATSLIAFPWCTWIFFSKRKAWHESR